MTHPSLIVICDLPANPKDLTPEQIRRICETGDLGALRDMAQECVALASASAADGESGAVA